MNITYKKIVAGLYDVLVDGKKVGKASKGIGVNKWTAYDLVSGTTAEGDTRKEAVANLLDSIQEEKQEKKLIELDLQYFAALVCNLCGGSGRIGGDILCWHCESPLETSRTFGTGQRTETVVNSVERALYELKECGEVLIQDIEVADLVRNQLREMDISFTAVLMEHGKTYISQDEQL